MNTSVVYNHLRLFVTLMWWDLTEQRDTRARYVIEVCFVAHSSLFSGLKFDWYLESQDPRLDLVSPCTSSHKHTIPMSPLS